MKRRSTFRRRSNPHQNHAYHAYRNIRQGKGRPEYAPFYSWPWKASDANITSTSLMPVPGETHRQFAARLKPVVQAAAAPAKPKRVRTKKAAA